MGAKNLYKKNIPLDNALRREKVILKRFHLLIFWREENLGGGDLYLKYSTFNVLGVCISYSQKISLFNVFFGEDKNYAQKISFVNGLEGERVIHKTFHLLTFWVGKRAKLKSFDLLIFQGKGQRYTQRISLVNGFFWGEGKDLYTKGFQFLMFYRGNGVIQKKISLLNVLWEESYAQNISLVNILGYKCYT